MAYYNPVHFRNLTRSRHKGGWLKLPPNLIFLFLCAACLLFWTRRGGLPANLSREDGGEFSYGPVRVERVLDYVGDGGNEFDAKHGDGNGEDNGDDLSEREEAGKDDKQEEEMETTVKEQDGSREEVEKNEVMKEDAIKEDVMEEDVMKEDTVKEDDSLDESVKTEEDDDSYDSKPVSRAPPTEQTIDEMPPRSEKKYEEEHKVEETSKSNEETTDFDPQTAPKGPQDSTPTAVDASDEKLPSLREHLNFSPKTAINFMHFHKTGGVSFKTALHKFYNNNKFKKDGNPVIIRDACYVRTGVSKEPGKPTFELWRCDWEPIRQMNEVDRNKHDFVFGHQFWAKGAGDLLNNRDLRTFTVLRHPFDRKVSFYYHFFVRENGRKEEDVTFEEIRDFLLYDKLIVNADLGRDLGPNYMAGRLLSDGVEGFVGNESFRYYDVPQHKKMEVADEALEMVRKYAFVGLQNENGASKCMLRKMMEVWNEVNGVSNEGTAEIEGGKKLNTGSYSMTAPEIWARFSKDDKIWFDRKERVDLTIYEEGERLFKKHVKIFGCEDRLKK